jgi:lipopolysaccharide heptosyltransferase I
MKALIVRLSSIGDVVHTLPALAALKRGNWEVAWLVEPAAAALLREHPMLSAVVVPPGRRGFAPARARAALRQLRAEACDVALDFQGLWKSAAWARASRAPRLLGFARPWRREGLSAMLLRETATLPPDLHHVIDKNLALLRPLGIDAVGSRNFPLPPTEAQSEAVRLKVAELELGPFAILNPGGGWTSKLWPAERYGSLARGLRERGLSALVTWGPGEEALADRVVGASEGAARRCFPTSLLEFAELARFARLVVAADTGPLHLACAVGTPVVGLYGPTDPARNGPFDSQDRVVRRIPLCSPCHRRRCRIHDGVMSAIAVGEVQRAIDARLAITSLQAQP